jgi:uncharacterized protein
MSEHTLQLIESILPFIGVGFLAQLIDGALGMAFGVITNTMLVAVMGLSPASASASVHLVETFTTAASGISHTIHKNVNWKLFGRLVIPGVIGGVTGAYVLSNIDGKVAKPFVMGYLVCIGFYLLWRAWRMDHGGRHKSAKIVEPLGLIGGFLDAVGGGGWGPVVTSNLLVQGESPRETIGSVNTAEFFLTAAVSATFIATIGFQAFTLATIGVLIGGLAAAPLGAILAKNIPARNLMLLVGVVLTATSLFSLYKALA